MNFVAIDFETANEMRCSPCSLGLTVVKDNKVVEEKYWLIRPKELRFQPINIMIHGIRPQEVEGEKEFDELWPELLPYLENTLVLAHNASFDFSVLRNTLDLYQLPYPKLQYGCTMVMSKQFYPFLENAKLNTVNSFLGFEFNHHHASADATACANIFLAICEELKQYELPQIANRLGISFGKLTPSGYQPCKKSGSSMSSKKSEGQVEKKVVTTTFDFTDKVVAITGTLKTMSREQAIDIIHRLGGTYGNVTKKTNLLITNTKNMEQLTPSQMSGKLRKAMDLIQKGQQIQIVNEDVFF